MAKKMESSAVTEARLALGVKQAVVEEARTRLAALQDEEREAGAKLRQALIDADAALPQCRMVSVAWRSGRAENDMSVVIVRKTAGGQLVVRRLGDPEAVEYRFNWEVGSEARFTQAEKREAYGSVRELRDVPAQFVGGAA